MNKIKQYIQESYHELLHKVSWPTWEELQSSTMVVLIATVIVTLLVWGMDIVSNAMLQNFYKFFR
ncbi:MAG TPA: preprotein translocase subunit SecE [Chitinophagaceae bacterium]|jgi:preprotein translocase subunit SecE|nr:preprotein translocase subunit SecE [Chitinophagaceae bacterium]